MSTARWPVVEPKAHKNAAGQPIGMESFFIALAKAMQLPGFGAAGLTDVDGQAHPLERAEDWYLRGGANIAWQGKTPVPDASDDDIAVSGVARIQGVLEKTLKPEEWRKVAFMLARGGRYQHYKDMFGLRLPLPSAAGASPAAVPEQAAYPADWSTHRFTKPMMLYNENLGTTKNSLTGKRFVGTPSWQEAAFADDTLLRKIYPAADWPLQLISYKSSLQNSYSIGARRLRGIHPDNPVALHPADAARLGLRSGDKVYLETPGGRATATVMLRRGVQRGVVAIEHGFGHREFGARAHRIAGKVQPHEPAIAAGTNLNDIGLSDPTRNGRNVLLDPVAGSTVRQGLPARLVRA